MKEKILIIHQGALGDSVLNFPAFISLKRERKASVALLCSSELGKTARALNIVDALFSLENARFSTLFGGEMTPFVKIFINNYDIIILISFSDAVEHHLRQNHGGEVHRICPRPPVDEEAHVALHLMKQLRAKRLLTSSDILFSFPFKVIPISYSSGGRMPQQEHVVVMHPGAGSARKRWPVKNFIEAAMVIKGEKPGEVVFLVGPAESDLAPVVKSMSNGDFRVYEVSDLVSLMELLKQTRCLIGNDSGVTHLSAFMGTPTVAIFGPSNPKRWSPVGRATKVLRGVVDCTPCFETDAANCEDPKCLNGVSIRMVFDAVRELAS
ncbi:MAG: glycosyltransferase family 9 protein [Desulfobacterales bacterium]|nr:MAG: glycosyltransferase family 9 protein [Desulfobacterales bacterium]